MTCTRCGGTGFLNVEQYPGDVFEVEPDRVLAWLQGNDETDVQVCDCCGDGAAWHGRAGEHYTTDDPDGPDGPYAYNGGLCECH